MSITAHAGPLVVFQNPTANENPEMAPSLFVQGSGLLDPRPFFTYNPGQNFGALTAGWLGTNRIMTLNVIPASASATIIAAAAHTVNGTAMTLASSAATGLQVGRSVQRSDTGVVVTGLLELDPPSSSVTASISAGTTIMTVTALGTGTAHNILSPGMVLSGTSVTTGTTLLPFGTNGTNGSGTLGTYAISTAPSAGISGGTITGTASVSQAVNTVPFSTAGTINLWNPTALCSRTLLYTCNNASGATTTFTARGFDIYGYPMTESVTITPGSATTAAGTKAFKYIQSITPNATDATYTFSVGTNDVIGFPLLSQAFTVGTAYDCELMMNNAVIAATTGYLAGVPTTATATTGDVRGTYALQTSSNSTLKFIVLQSPIIGQMASQYGQYGVPQFADF